MMRPTVRTRVRWGLIGVSLAFFTAVLILVIAGTAAALLLEAKRVSDNNSIKNIKALHIGLAYIVVVSKQILLSNVRVWKIHLELLDGLCAHLHVRPDTKRSSQTCQHSKILCGYP